MDDVVMGVIVDFISWGAKYAGFIALITYGVNLVLKAARGKTRFM